MQCPNCGGDMWDNRRTKRSPKAPDFKCKDANCIDPKSGMVTACWVPKPKPVADPDADYDRTGRDPEYDEQPPQRTAPAPRNITKHTEEKKEMVMSYAKDLVVAELVAGRIPTDESVIDIVESYFDRLILKVRSV